MLRVKASTTRAASSGSLARNRAQSVASRQEGKAASGLFLQREEFLHLRVLMDQRGGGPALFEPESEQIPGGHGVGGAADEGGEIGILSTELLQGALAVSRHETAAGGGHRMFLIDAQGRVEDLLDIPRDVVGDGRQLQIVEGDGDVFQGGGMLLHGGGLLQRFELADLVLESFPVFRGLGALQVACASLLKSASLIWAFCRRCWSFLSSGTSSKAAWNYSCWR